MEHEITEEDVERISKGDDINGLLELLEDSNMIVRERSVKILGETGNPRVVRPLIELLRHDREWRVQKAAAEALEKFGDCRAVEPLIEALRDKDKLVRQAAVEALSHERRAAGALIDLLYDEDRSIRLQVIALLKDIGDRAAAEPLVLLLEDPDPNVRKQVLQALGKLKDAGSVENVIMALRDKDENVREEAVRALGKFSDPEIIRPLIGRIGSDETHEGVRTAAMDVLKRCRDMAVKPLLNEMIEVTDGLKRDNIKEILGHLFNRFLRFEEELTKAKKVKRKKVVVRKTTVAPVLTLDGSESPVAENVEKEEKGNEVGKGVTQKTTVRDTAQVDKKGSPGKAQPARTKKDEEEDAGKDVITGLRELVDMKKDGFLDDDEFKKAKSKLLNS